MSENIYNCRRCGIELDDENWAPYYKNSNRMFCKNCILEYGNKWRRENPKYKPNWDRANPEKQHMYYVNRRRKYGMLSLSNNKECSLFLGVHVAEQVLSKAFKNVERMPQNNPGYDFICSKGKKIDVKSSTFDKKTKRWIFHVGKNKIADYFLCLAFDNRENLNPEHMWIIPGEFLNHKITVSIGITKIKKWDKYRLDIDRVVLCCDTIKKKK